MECTFKKGFKVLKEEILATGTIKHLIKLGESLIFIEGTHLNIDGADYLFSKNIRPYYKSLLKNAEGIFFAENSFFDRYTYFYEYIIKIEAAETYKLSDPMMLVSESEFRGVKKIEHIKHTGYYGCGTITGLSFNVSGRIGFLPDGYIPMLKGEFEYREYREGRWNKLYGYQKYSIIAEQWVKDFIISYTDNKSKVMAQKI